MQTKKIYLVKDDEEYTRVGTQDVPLNQNPTRKLLAKYLSEHVDSLSSPNNMTIPKRIMYLAWLINVQEATIKTLLNNTNDTVPESDIKTLVQFYVTSKEQ